jgi:hypothetical protein
MDDLNFNEFLQRSRMEWEARWLKLKLWVDDQCSEGRTEFIARLINVDAIGKPGAIVIECTETADSVQISLQDG